MADKADKKTDAPAKDKVTTRKHRTEREKVEALAEKATAKVERMRSTYDNLIKSAEEYKASLATAEYEADLWNSHPLLADDDTSVKDDTKKTD